MKKAPELNRTENDGYAQLLAMGFDTVHESYNVILPKELQDRLDKWQATAKERASDRGEPYTMQFGGVEFQIRPFGAKGGITWVIENPDYIISISRREWGLSCHYKSPVLWRWGFERARCQFLQILTRECKPVDENNFSKISRFDYCFDFHASKFTHEMQPEIVRNLVCVSGVKKRVTGKLTEFDFFMRGVEGETLTIGTKACLQVQIYNKAREIKAQLSGKTWFLDIWRQNGFQCEGDDYGDVWRVEFRFAKEFLKARNCRRFEEVMRFVPELITEALSSRRLTRPTSDKNRARWPIHELWTACFEALDNPKIVFTRGNYLEETGRRIYHRMKDNTKGTVRAAVTLDVGDYDEQRAREFMEEVLAEIRKDKDHELKVSRAQERYKNIHCPK